MRHTRLFALGLVLPLALAAAACGDDEEASGAGGSTSSTTTSGTGGASSSTTTTTDATTTTADTTTSTSGAGGAGGATGSGGESSTGGAGGGGGAPSLYCAAELAVDAAPLMEGVLYLSESDYPVDAFGTDPVPGTGVITAAELLAALSLPADSPVEVRDLSWFFNEYVLQSEDAAKYQALEALLQEHLTNLTVIRVGEIHIDVYVVGRTSCGELAGVQTVVIET